MRSFVLWLGAAMMLGGCSTVVKGTSQQIAVTTPGVQGAMCELSSPAIGTQTVQAPATVTLKKSRHNVAVRCVAQCYAEGIGIIPSHTEVMTAGNVLVGGVIGLGVDAASGAMNTYEPSVAVNMSPIPNCGQPTKRKKGTPMAVSPIPQKPPA
jgi:hypothetical protein